LTSWPKDTGVYGSDTPLYERVLLDLTTALFAEPPPNGKLPAETQLCARLGVSRTTLRHAIDELEVHGLVVRRHGVGTFFVGRDVMPPGSQPEAAIDLLRSIPGFHTRSLLIDTVIPHESVQTRLSLSPEALALHVRRLDCVGSVPIALVDAFLPTTVLRSASHRQIESQSLYSLLSRHRIPVLHMDQTIYSERWSDADLRQVGASTGECALVLERTTFSVGRAPVEFSILRFRPRTVRIEMSVSAAGRLNGTLQFGVVQP
jgi:GntR family transcriptional regulator